MSSAVPQHITDSTDIPAFWFGSPCGSTAWPDHKVPVRADDAKRKVPPEHDIVSVLILADWKTIHLLDNVIDLREVTRTGAPRLRQWTPEALRAILPVEDHREVYEFLSRHGIEADFDGFVGIAVRHFPQFRALSAYTDGDPEEPGFEWVVLEAEVPGTIDAVWEQYERFNQAVLDALPLRAGDLLRLSLSIGA